MEKPKYTARRKKIYKGKVARTGTLFLELVVRRNGRKFTSVRQIEGGKGPEAERNIITQMYIGILKEYYPNEIDEIEQKKKGK